MKIEHKNQRRSSGAVRVTIILALLTFTIGGGAYLNQIARENALKGASSKSIITPNATVPNRKIHNVERVDQTCSDVTKANTTQYVAVRNAPSDAAPVAKQNDGQSMAAIAPKEESTTEIKSASVADELNYVSRLLQKVKAKDLTKLESILSKLDQKISVDEVTEKYTVYIAVANGNKKSVNARIKILDTKNPKNTKKIKANEFNYFAIDKSSLEDKTIVIENFGYMKKELEIDLKSLENGEYNEVVLLDNIIVVQEELEPYRKNDVVTMYQVFFQDDANVMLPKSKAELDELYNMMVDNPTVKIRIHGHANGNKFGKIVKLDEADTSFFSLSESNLKTIGTSQDLSEERASVLKRYLVARNISEDRIEVKGWGGKKPLYSPNSLVAHKNKRVDIEIVEE